MSTPSEQKPKEEAKIVKEPSTAGAPAGGKKKNKNKKKKDAQKAGTDGHAAASQAAAPVATSADAQKSDEHGALIKKIADLKYDQEKQV